jgi:hypothetical protein
MPACRPTVALDRVAADQAVTDDRITAAQATQEKTQVDQRIDQMMTSVRP